MEFMTEEQQMIQQTAQKFAAGEVEAKAVEMDMSEELPLELIQQCGELGFFGLMIPEAYGGSGLGLTTTCLVLEEIAKASPALAGLLNVDIVLTPLAVLIAGTEEQKQRFLAPSATGEETIAWSSTEPSGSTNLMAHQTTITEDGDGYRLDGVKLFCSQGQSKRVLVFAKTNVDGQPGMGAAMVDFDWDGVEVAPHEDKLGWRGTNTGTVNFNNVYVPKENIVGSLQGAYQQVLPANRASAMGHSASSLGAMKGLLAKTIDYVKERDIYGANMSRLQPMSFRLADAQCKAYACESMLYNSTRRYDENLPVDMNGPMCKAYICDTAFEVTSNLVQMWGGTGMMNDTGINRYMRDARINMVAEGPSELFYDVLAANLLERPAYFHGWRP